MKKTMKYYLLTLIAFPIAACSQEVSEMATTPNMNAVNPIAIKQAKTYLSENSNQAKHSCVSLLIHSSNQNSVWSQEVNIKFAANYMAEHAPQSLSACYYEREDADAYREDLHGKAAEVFANALWVRSPEEASIKIIEAAREEHIDTYYISKLALQGNASEKSIKKALAIIKKREPQVHKNLVENFKENGVLE